MGKPELQQKASETREGEERPGIPASPKKPPKSVEDTSGRQTELKAAIKEKSEEIVRVQSELREGDQNEEIPTDAAPLALAANKVEEMLNTDDIRKTLETLDISRGSAKTAILKLAGGIAQKIGLTKVEAAFEQTFTPAITALTQGLAKIISSKKIHPRELKNEFNRLTGKTVFAETGINAAELIGYLSTHSAEKIASDTGNIERFYELSGELQNVKAELGTLEEDGNQEDIGKWLKGKSILIQKSFPKKDMAEYLAGVIPESIRESDRGREILQYLETRIEELAEENDAVTVKPDGTIEVIKETKLREAAAQQAQATAESGEKAPQNPIMAMLVGFITFIKKLIEGFQKLFGKNPEPEKASATPDQNPAKSAEEPKETAENQPGSEAKETDEDAGEKEKLRIALGERKLEFSEEQLSDTLITALKRHKNETAFKTKSWTEYLRDFLSDEDAQKIRAGSLAEKQIIALITEKHD